MGNKRITRTSEKHAEIYEEYESVLKDYSKLQTPDGRLLRSMTPYANRTFLYEIVAEKCKCSTGHVQQVVCKILRKDN